MSCHYELKNLPENRCPECGSKFDPNNSDTFDTKIERALLAPLWIFILLAALGVLFPLLAALDVLGVWRGAFAALGGGVWGGFFNLIYQRRLANKIRN